MIDKNDPRLTAYVLGDLEKSEIAAIDAALENSAELRTYVAEIRQTTEALAGIFEAEPEMSLDEPRKSKVLAALSTSQANSDVHYSASPSDSFDDLPKSSRSRRWLPIAVAAGLMSVLVGGGVYFSQSTSRMAAQFENVSSPATESAQPPAFSAKDMEEPENDQKTNLADAGVAAQPSESSAEIGDLQSPPLAVIPKDQAVPAARKVTGDQAKTASTGVTSDLPSGGLPQSLASPSRSFGAAGIGQPASVAAEGGMAAKSSMQQSPKVAAANAAVGQANDIAGRDPAMTQPTRSPNGAELARQSPAAAAEASKPAIVMGDNALIKTAKEIQLAQTQKMIDRSNLGIMGMTVVAAEQRRSQKSSNGDSKDGSGGGGLGANGLGVGRPSAVTLPIDNFSLQISEPQAAKAVELLAAKIDPNNKRKLTFDDLIAVVAENRLVPPAAQSQSPRTARRNSKAEIKANLQEQAARQLAFNLRSFIGQKSPPAEIEMGTGGTVDLVPDTFGDDKEMNRSADPKGAARTEQSGKQSAKQKSQQFSAWSDLQLLDLDYSQVVEQLKRSLEIRNGKLKTD